MTVKIIRGEELLGLKIKPLFPYYTTDSELGVKSENAFRVLHADFVNLEEGTGIVHIAPGFGEDDQLLCKNHNIPTICPIDDGGKFEHMLWDIEYQFHNNKELLSLKGRQVFDTNDDIIKYLKSSNTVLKIEQYIHNYPHCWRSDTPLIYRAVSSWYVAVTKIKERMVELNEQINWIPHNVKRGIFGKWLSNARDWSISRNRFWGCPVPVWKSNDPAHPRIEVYGSIAELEEAFGPHYEQTHGHKLKITDLHRPFIDQLIRPNPDDPTGKSMMIRTEEVLDCWFESGSMPYASIHYPFAYKESGKIVRSAEENQEWFFQHLPADFIVEYMAQTRGWFYTLMVLSTALFDRIPFKNCISHGVILDENCQKLSKRLRNYPDPMRIFDLYGSDAMRLAMMRSPVMQGQGFNIDIEGKCIKEVVRTTMSSLWSAFSFFKMYFESDCKILLQHQELNTLRNKASFLLNTQSKNVMDQYIMAKLHVAVQQISHAMNEYNTPLACRAIEDFLETLNNWYIRRSKKRFWSSIKAEGEEYQRLSGYIGAFQQSERLRRGLQEKLAEYDGRLNEEGNDSVEYSTKQKITAAILMQPAAATWRIQNDSANNVIVIIDEDKASAYQTLYSVLYIFVHAVAPLLPCVSEHIYQELY